MIKNSLTYFFFKFLIIDNNITKRNVKYCLQLQFISDVNDVLLGRKRGLHNYYLVPNPLHAFLHILQNHYLRVIHSAVQPFCIRLQIFKIANAQSLL